MTTTQATLVYTATVLKPGPFTRVLAEMQPSAVPLPLPYLFGIGVGVVSDSAVGGIAPAQQIRTSVLSLVPDVLPTATASIVGGSDAAPIKALTLTGRGQGLIRNPIWKVVETSPGITPIRPANVTSTLRVRAVSIATGGSNYSGATKLIAAGGLMAPNGVQATLTPVIAPLTGEITAVTVADPGGPYITPPLSIIAVDSVGSGATFDIADMEIKDLFLNDPGAGYISPSVQVTSFYKYFYPDSIGAAAQGLAFVNLITTALMMSASSPVIASAPAVS